jgi:hypothetical protein
MPKIQFSTIAFSAPLNWCDRRCERCLLAARCPVPSREQSSSSVRDQANPGEAVFRLIQTDGCEKDSPPAPPAEIVLDAGRLRDAGVRMVESLAKHSRPDSLAELDAEVSNLAFLIATKSARIAHHLEHGDDPASYGTDAAPNLLLISHLKEELKRKLARLTPFLDDETQSESFSALAHLQSVLDPLIDLLDTRFTALLILLVRSGKAPSPFCIRE